MGRPEGNRRGRLSAGPRDHRATGSQAARPRGRRQGFSSAKPFDLAELRARVHNILEVRLLHLESKNYSKVLEETVRELEASRE